jgi:hypothetical protein
MKISRLVLESYHFSIVVFGFADIFQVAGIEGTLWYVNTHSLNLTKLNSLAFSSQGNYTDWTSDRRLSAKLVPTLRIEGVAWSAQRIPTAVGLGFLDRSSYFSIQVAPQLSSRGWMDPVLKIWK